MQRDPVVAGQQARTAGCSWVAWLSTTSRDVAGGVPEEHADGDDEQDGDAAYQSLSGRYSPFS